MACMVMRPNPVNDDQRKRHVVAGEVLALDSRNWRLRMKADSLEYSTVDLGRRQSLIDANRMSADTDELRYHILISRRPFVEWELFRVPMIGQLSGASQMITSIFDELVDVATIQDVARDANDGSVLRTWQRMVLSRGYVNPGEVQEDQVFRLGRMRLLKDPHTHTHTRVCAADELSRPRSPLMSCLLIIASGKGRSMRVHPRVSMRPWAAKPPRFIRPSRFQ